MLHIYMTSHSIDIQVSSRLFRENLSFMVLPLLMIRQQQFDDVFDNKKPLHDVHFLILAVSTRHHCLVRTKQRERFL